MLSALLLSASLLAPAAGAQEGRLAGQCTNNIDDDGDGTRDRAGLDLNGDGDYFDAGEIPPDNECRIEQNAGPFVAVTNPNRCADGIDNDADGVTDGADADCNYEYFCQDGEDNDGDGRLESTTWTDVNGNGRCDPAGAEGECDCMCLDDVETFPGGNICTANDIEIVLVGLGVPTDGCINTDDQISIYLGAQLGSQGGNTRYDVQAFVGINDFNGATADNDALSGRCARQVLLPAIANGSTPTVSQLSGGFGPFRNEDGAPDNDRCGEIRGSDDVVNNPNTTNDPDAIYNFPIPVTLACSDAFNSDGFLDVPTCASYEQNSDDGCVDPNGALPIESSKCRCDPATPSNIPVPNLRCGSVPNPDTGVIQNIGEMVCTDLGNDGAAVPTPIGVAGDGDLTPGEAAECVVRYRNAPVGTCTPPLTFATADAERFACGAVGFVRFDINYDQTRGAIIGTPTTSLDSGTTDSVTTVAPNILRWTPISASGSPQGVGIVRRGDASTLTFRYRANPTNVGAQSVSFTMNNFWANNQTFTQSVQQGALSCADTLRTTPVTIGFFTSKRSGAVTELEWVTETESGNVGFNVYGRVGADWVLLNDETIPSHAISSMTAATYRFSTSEEASQFSIETVDLRGEPEMHGPYRMGRDYGARQEKVSIDWAAVRAGLDVEPSGRMRITSSAKGGPQGNPANGATSGSGPIALSVSETGLHRVTSESLLAAGFDFSKVQVADLALSVGGQQVPIRVSGGKFFSAGAYFEFWGEALDTLYSGTNVYRLDIAKKTGLRIAADGTAPGAGAGPASYLETVDVETNTVYSLNVPGPDPFVERLMQRFGSPVSRTFTFDVQGLVPGGTETVQLEAWGVTTFGTPADHHLKVLLNGVEVADRSFGGLTQLLVDVPVNGLLVEGSNSLTVQLLADNGLPVDVVAIEGYGATYSRAPVAQGGSLVLGAAGSVIEVSGLPSSNGVAYRLDPSGPVHLTGATFAGGIARLPGSAGGATFAVADASALLVPGIGAARTPTGLLSGEAEYLVITHEAFAGGLGPLVAARESNGLSVAVVDVADIYAAYSGGVVDAQAIRSYIADAVQQRGTQYVLLVGSDTYDYRNFVGSSISFVPSLYAATDAFVRHAPVDPLYADIDGDGVQDIAIGRFPVRTLAELGYMVDKTLQYEGKDYDGTAVVAADKFDAVASISFKVQGNQFLGGLAGWQGTTAYLDDTTVNLARQSLVGAINAGSALTAYFGHSAPSVWTFSSLFNVSHVNALANQGRPTVVAQFGCWNTYHVEPAFNTLGHAWTVFGTQGAAAALGSSTLVDDDHASMLAAEFAPMVSTPGLSIGFAMVEAKQNLAVKRGGLTDVQLGWSLLGDPALVVSP